MQSPKANRPAKVLNVIDQNTLGNVSITTSFMCEENAPTMTMISRTTTGIKSWKGKCIIRKRKNACLSKEQWEVHNPCVEEYMFQWQCIVSYPLRWTNWLRWVSMKMWQRNFKFRKRIHMRVVMKIRICPLIQVCPYDCFNPRGKFVQGKQITTKRGVLV